MDSLWIYALLAVVVVGTVAVLVMRQRESQTEGVTGVLPYRKRDYFFTKAERSFYEVLLHSIPGDLAVFSKVRLADLVYLPRGTEKRQSYFNRIQAKHVDFVLCDRGMLAPVLAIELDDASHQRQDRQDRDEFVDQVLLAAGLPLIRVPAQREYAPRELMSMIQEKLSPPVPDLTSPPLVRQTENN